MMTDSCTVRRLTGGRTQDEATGRDVAATQVLYQGRCRYQVPNTQASDATAGDFAWTLQDVALQLPMDAPLVPVGALVEVTACGLDPTFVGRVLRVRAQVPPKSHATRRTAACVFVAP